MTSDSHFGKEVSVGRKIEQFFLAGVTIVTIEKRGHASCARGNGGFLFLSRRKELINLSVSRWSFSLVVIEGFRFADNVLCLPRRHGRWRDRAHPVLVLLVVGFAAASHQSI